MYLSNRISVLFAFILRVGFLYCRMQMNALLYARLFWTVPKDISLLFSVAQLLCQILLYKHKRRVFLLKSHRCFALKLQLAFLEMQVTAKTFSLPFPPPESNCIRKTRLGIIAGRTKENIWGILCKKGRGEVSLPVADLGGSCLPSAGFYGSMIVRKELALAGDMSKLLCKIPFFLLSLATVCNTHDISPQLFRNVYGVGNKYKLCGTWYIFAAGCGMYTVFFYTCFFCLQV